MSSSEIPTKQKAVVITAFGGPEVIEYREDCPVPEIGDTDVLVKNSLAGLNYIDIQIREARYPAFPPPFTPGVEGAGVIVAVGSKVTYFEVGDTVMFFKAPAFAQYSKVDSTGGTLFKLPNADEEKLKRALASFMTGMTALAFVEEAYKVKKGDIVFVHSAAGGTGLYFVQFAKERGATVIGSTSTEEKVKLVKEFGADHVINYKTQDTEEEVKKITNGRGVDVVYDAIGHDSFALSINLLKRKGILVGYGAMSSPITGDDIKLMIPKAISLVKPSLYSYCTTPAEIMHYWTQFLSFLETAKVHIEGVYDLKDYKKANELMETGKNKGKILLKIPQ